MKTVGMTTSNSKLQLHDWLKYIDNKAPEVSIEKFLKITEKLAANNLPVIIGFASLSHFLQISQEQIFSIAGAKNKFYREFYIPKRTGGKRKITTPYPFLHILQRRILDEILTPYQNSLQQQHIHGFTQGKSTLTNATAHLKNAEKKILKMDIEDFFGSVRYRDVEKIFLQIGYPEKISRFLARLTTYKGSLPQGSPSSPAISNIAFTEHDKAIVNICNANNLTYSRYADDISISGDVNIEFSKNIKSLLANTTFSINPKKTKILKDGFSITGISISTGNTKLPSRIKKQYKRDIYYIKKYGFIDAMHRNKDTCHTHPEVIYGRLMYWRSIEGETTEVLIAFNEYWKAMHEAGLKLG